MDNSLLKIWAYFVLTLPQLMFFKKVAFPVFPIVEGLAKLLHGTIVQASFLFGQADFGNFKLTLAFSI